MYLSTRMHILMSTFVLFVVDVFGVEIIETLKSAIANVVVCSNEETRRSLIENTCVEINALKFAFNTTFENVRRQVIPVFVEEITGASPAYIQQV